MNILSSLSNLLNSLKSAVSQLFSQIGSFFKSSPTTQTPYASVVSPTPPAVPRPTTTPVSRVSTTQSTEARPISSGTITPRGTMIYHTTAGPVEISPNVKITNLPVTYAPTSGLISVGQMEEMAKKQAEGKEGVYGTNYSIYREALVSSPITSTSLTTPTTQPSTTQPSSTEKTTEKTTPITSTTLTQPLEQNLIPLSSIPQVKIGSPSIGYSSFPSGKGTSGAIAPLGTISQSLLSGLFTYPEEEKQKEQTIKTTTSSIPSPETKTGTTAGTIAGKTITPSIDERGMVDLAAQQAAAEAVKILANPDVKLTAEDFDRLFQQKKQAIYEQYKIQNPLPENPVPKPEYVFDNQQLIEQANLNPADFDAVMVKYGIPDLIKQMNDMQNQIIAENQAWESAVADIKNNPDFPKKLAQRRIAQLHEVKNNNLETLKTKYNFLVELFNIKLNLAKQEYASMVDVYNQQRQLLEQRRDNARQMIQQMISTGAIANLSDNELQQWANVSGYTLDSLKSIRKAVKTGNDLKIQQAQAKLEKTTQTTTAPKSITGANYNTRLNQEIANLYAGRYGTTGAREKVINILQREFPSVDVAGDIYNRVPDNWEETAKKASPINFEDL